MAGLGSLPLHRQGVQDVLAPQTWVVQHWSRGRVGPIVEAMMFFGKRRDKNRVAAEAAATAGEEVVESAKTAHGRFTIIPRAKQLLNGNWIARITLEEDTDLGARVYDFTGPMAEYDSKDGAVRGGIEHAKRRLDEVL